MTKLVEECTIYKNNPRWKKNALTKHKYWALFQYGSVDRFQVILQLAEINKTNENKIKEGNNGHASLTYVKEWNKRLTMSAVNILLNLCFQGTLMKILNAILAL